MIERLSSKELVGLSGMPGTERGVRKKAKREGWRSCKANSTGGRPSDEYYISDLPESTRIELARKTISTTDTESAKAGKTAAKKLKKKTQTKKHARQTGSKDFSSLNETGKKRVGCQAGDLKCVQNISESIRIEGLSGDGIVCDSI